MATLAGIQGRSLVGDLGPALKTVRESFAAAEERAARQSKADEERRKESDIAKQIEDIIAGEGGAPAAPPAEGAVPDPTADPGAKRSTAQAALLRLGALNPQLAQVTRQTLDAGDEAAKEALRTQAVKGARSAAFLTKQPDFAAKQRGIGVLARDAAARGEPLDKFIALQNMSEDELGLELQRMQIAAQDINTLLAPPEQFAPIRDASGNIIGQRSTTTGKVIKDPRARGEGSDSFAKSPGVISRTAEGVTMQIPVMNKGTGQIELKSVPVPGKVVSRLGETGTELSLRRAGEAGLAEMNKRLAQLETAAEIKGEEAAGSAAIRRSEKAFDQIAKIKTSIGNIDKAIELVDAGAKTGPIMSKLPSIRSASVQLDNVQKAMGLDVIGTTTFGALSKGELDLALSKALPTGLKEDALREWLVDKKSAQEKLSGYLEDAAFFLGTPGNSVADWIALQREVGGSAVAPKRIKFDAQGNVIP